MKRLIPVLGFLVVAAVACSGKSGGSKPDAAPKYPATADGLKSLFQDIRKAIVDGDTKSAAALSRSLIGDAARLKKSLKDDTPAATLEKILAMHADLRSADESKAAALFKTEANRSEVQVHGATTEAIAAGAGEFPGGAKELATTILRPGVTFYEVEYLEPGKDAGMKYHLVFWDGSSWTMLGPMWRALK